MVELRRPRLDTHGGLEAVVHNNGHARVLEADDLSPHDERWELLLDNLEDLLILAAWMFFLLAGGILIFR